MKLFRLSIIGQYFKEFNSRGIDFVIFITFLILSLISFFLINIQSSTNSVVIQFLINSNGNILGVIVATFFFNCLIQAINLKARLINALSAGIGIIIYEFLQILLPWQTYDVYDILATFIGIALAALISGVLSILNYWNRRTDKLKN